MRPWLLGVFVLPLACSQRLTTPAPALDAGIELLDASVPDSGVALFVGLARDEPFATDGGLRRYHLYAPPRAPGELRPLVLVLHGNGGNANQLLGLENNAAPTKRWLDLGQRERVFVVFPFGVAPDGGEPGWNDCRGDNGTNPTTDDVSFLVSLVEHVAGQGVDRARVFANGASNGGMMSLRLAIERPDVFRAVAPVIAAMPAASKCPPPSRPVSVLFINGTRDPLVPFDGGAVVGPNAGRGTVISTRASVDTWRAVNGVTTPEVEAPRPDSFMGDRSTVVEVTSRAAWPTVALLRVEEGGHTEPSPTERYAPVYLLAVGRQNGDIEMAEEAWRFFASQGP